MIITKPEKIKYLKIKPRHFNRIRQKDRLYTVRLADWNLNEFNLIVFYSQAFPDKYAVVVDILNSMYFPPAFIKLDKFKDKDGKKSNPENFLMTLCSDKNIARDVLSYYDHGDILKYGIYIINFDLNDKVDEKTTQGIKNVLRLKKTVRII